MSPTFYDKLKAECANQRIHVQTLASQCGITFSSVEQWIRGDLPSARDLSILCKELHISETALLTATELEKVKRGHTVACSELGRRAGPIVDAQTALNIQYLLLETEPGKEAFIRAGVDLILAKGKHSHKNALLDSIQTLTAQIFKHRLEL